MNKTIATAFRYIRTKREMTQEEVQDLAKTCLSNYESDYRMPRIDKFCAVCIALNVRCFVLLEIIQESLVFGKDIINLIERDWRRLDIDKEKAS